MGGFRGGLISGSWGGFVSGGWGGLVSWGGFMVSWSWFGFMISWGRVGLGFMVSWGGMWMGFGFVLGVHGFSFISYISNVSVFISMISD